jgi:hypothetical protein
MDNRLTRILVMPDGTWLKDSNVEFQWYKEYLKNRLIYIPRNSTEKEIKVMVEVLNQELSNKRPYLRRNKSNG